MKTKILLRNLSSLSILMLCLVPYPKLIGQNSFQNISDLAGIDHIQRTYDHMGGGACIFDFNNDGFEDIYLTGGVDPDKLYLNNGDTTFTDISNAAGLAFTSNINTLACNCSDLDNDGYKDLIVTTGFGFESIVMKNNNGERFLNASSVANISDEDEFTSSVTTLDVNKDGLLDLYFGFYINHSELIFDDKENIIGYNHGCGDNVLFINNGNFEFEAQTEVYNAKNAGCALAIMAFDIDFDGYQDIYTANDFGAWVHPNSLLIYNPQNSTFEEKAIEFGLNDSIYGMGIAYGDVNGDVLPEIYVTNLGDNRFHLNNGNGFSDITESTGTANEYSGSLYSTSWGTFFFDYNNDGLLDLFVSNGYVPAAQFIATNPSDPNKLYKNLGNLNFEDVSEIENLPDEGISRGVAYTDIDNNGYLDVVITKLSNGTEPEPNTIMLSNKLSGKNWLKIALEGTVSNRDGYGTKVYVYCNNEIYYRECVSGSSYASQNSSLLHFGLGDNLLIDSISTIWPSGQNQMFYNIEPNQFLSIQEGADELQILGCMESNNEYYNAQATVNCCCSPNTTSGIIQELTSEFKFHFSQSSQTLQIISDYVDFSKFSLVIFDMQGRQIQGPFTNHEGTYQLSLIPGLYIYNFSSKESQISHTNKIVVH